MLNRIKPVLGAFLTLSCLYLVGFFFFFGPIAAEDAPGDPLVPKFLGFLIAIVLYIALFVWVSREMGSPLKAAFTVALSQFLLVDVDFVLTGDRGVMTALASTILLFVSWGLTGWVYGKLDKHDRQPAS